MQKLPSVTPVHCLQEASPTTPAKTASPHHCLPLPLVTPGTSPVSPSGTCSRELSLTCSPGAWRRLSQDPVE